jgi:uncharacterized protein YuzB (UPF0349 family)
MTTSFTVDGNKIICEDGCEQVCGECMSELYATFVGDATKAYIGSGEDVPLKAKREDMIAL